MNRIDRKKEYKKGIDAEDARRKREDNIIELRKNKRDERLQKKRQVNVGSNFGIEESTRSSLVTNQQKVIRGVVVARASCADRPAVSAG
jgi:hypothetical protein